MTQRSIPEARALISDVWGGMESCAASVAIANAVLDHIEEHRPSRIGFGTVVQLAGREEPDEDVMRAMAMLTQSRAAVLTSVLLFNDEGDWTQVSKDSYERARSGKDIFRHPRTGKEVVDFDDRIHIEFDVHEEAYANLPPIKPAGRLP